MYMYIYICKLFCVLTSICICYFIEIRPYICMYVCMYVCSYICSYVYIDNVLFRDTTPPPRYLGASVFIPSKTFNVKHSYGYRTLYDNPIMSNAANFQGLVSDSFIMFGGHNGASGSIVDGSSGMHVEVYVIIMIKLTAHTFILYTYMCIYIYIYIYG